MIVSDSEFTLADLSKNLKFIIETPMNKSPVPELVAHVFKLIWSQKGKDVLRDMGEYALLTTYFSI